MRVITAKLIDRRVSRIVLIASAILLSLLFTAGHAHADTPDVKSNASGTVSILGDYCDDHVKDKDARKGCTNKEMTRARNVATHHCTDKSTDTNEMYNCIVKSAESYIDSAKDAKTKDGFIKQLEAKLAKVGGDASKVSEESKKGDTSGAGGTLDIPETKATGDKCGSSVDGNSPVKTSINIGCKGKGNAVLDMLFAFIRFLTAGAGLVMVGSLVLGGIQYTISRGDPQGTAAAVNRIRSVLFSLLFFIFAFAILNYIIPGMVLK